MRDRTWGLRPLLISTLGVLCVGTAVAQISPGPLSSPHADLEGSDRCLQCHSQKKRISAERCLDCHEILRQQLDQQRGFHATVAEQGCERCHMEHHGVDFELVYWGEEGETAFDHGQTSFELQGAHRSLACRSCHKESLIRSKSRFQERRKNLNRTFLGLDGSACLSCHQDEHRGQFEDRTCETCHTVEKWTEGSLFRHESARYPLVGRHVQVACDRCHTRDSGDASSTDATGFVKYVGLPFSNCTDCHRDPHEKRLGSACLQCHSESGWGSVEIGSFDHGRTRFALEGAHQQTRCEGCHPSGATTRLTRFENCTDCHADHHLGQFAARAQEPGCDACHDVQGFRPARFSLAGHQESKYPLEGAHLAVACDRCHVPLDRQQIQERMRSGAGRSRDLGGQILYQYTFPSTLCSTCHRNPHEDSVTRFMLERDCLACHDIESWRRIDFDHERTDYSLVGGHEKKAGCLDCHRINEPGEEAMRLQFDGLPQDCTACHEDPHVGQFDGSEEQAVCTRCHSLESWQRLSFDHDRDSSFSLDGVHVRVDCSGCHSAQSEGEGAVVRYKPLGQECRDCHTGKGQGGL